MFLFFIALFLTIKLVDWAVAFVANGPLSRHMLAHIVLMNLVAPLAALGLIRGLWVSTALPFAALAAATAVQLMLLWAWHAPPLLTASLEQPIVHVVASATLSVAALWFWLAVFTITGARRWQAIAALLITGKLFCLLGALLIFAPRTLYVCAATSICGPGVPASLDDQQMAGVVMVVACPLTYVTAGVIIAARWLFELSQREPAAIPRAREVEA
ncbi:MAG: cytochrome c oxidase assembly protein [Alphaproteobacteria bacterium]|nr:cytochrome c oxidase assembly protein [Alphaproteobacteria bacterium]